MKLTPFAKFFITVVILGVLGYAFWHYKGADVRKWAVGDKGAAPVTEKVAANDFDALKNAPADPDRNQGSTGVTGASLQSGGHPLIALAQAAAAASMCEDHEPGRPGRDSEVARQHCEGGNHHLSCSLLGMRCCGHWSSKRCHPHPLMACDTPQGCAA